MCVYLYLFLFVVCVYICTMQWLTAPLEAWTADLLTESEEEFRKRAKQLEIGYKKYQKYAKECPEKY